MMPFGEWFDRYYQEIYVPAIKEAGFEPVRADELFTTGSVVERIWGADRESEAASGRSLGQEPERFLRTRVGACRKETGCVHSFAGR